MNNLKNIHGSALAYARRKGGYFPLASPLRDGSPPPAYESLNVLLTDSASRGLEARLFVCDASDAAPAESEEFIVNALPESSAASDSKGTSRSAWPRFNLDEETLSYTWVARPTAAFGPPRPLSSDRYAGGWRDVHGTTREGHEGSLVVLQTDGSVSERDIDECDSATGLPPGLVR